MGRLRGSINKNHSGIEKKCEKCGKNYYVQLCLLNRKKFCSRECYRKSLIGKKHSEEHRRKISESLKKVGAGKWMIGRKLTKKHKTKISVGIKKFYQNNPDQLKPRKICPMCKSKFYRNERNVCCSLKCRLKKSRKEIICITCGKKVSYKLSQFKWRKGKYCSPKCSGIDKRGEKSPNWKGGKYLDKLGYVRITGNYGKDRRKREHRIVMEEYLKRKLTKNEVIHHIDGNKTNNKLNNLFLCDNSRHQLAHKSMEPVIYYLMSKGLIGFKNGKYHITKKRQSNGVVKRNK